MTELVATLKAAQQEVEELNKAENINLERLRGLVGTAFIEAKRMGLEGKLENNDIEVWAVKICPLDGNEYDITHCKNCTKFKFCRKGDL